MDTVFKKDSWLIKDTISKKMLNNEKPVEVRDNTKMKYLKPIFFDEKVAFEIEIMGEIIFDINNKQYKVYSEKLEKFFINIENEFFTCKENCDKINIIKDQYLEIILNKDTIVNKFNIIKDLEIESCNQNK